MKKEYDFSKAKKNPYILGLKKQFKTAHHEILQHCLGWASIIFLFMIV